MPRRGDAEHRIARPFVVQRAERLTYAASQPSACYDEACSPVLISGCMADVPAGNAAANSSSVSGDGS